MAFIIGVQNPKGGTGKTTLASNLGRAAHREGCRTLLVDSDRQRTLTRWHESAEALGIDVIAAATPGAIKSLRQVATSYDLVLIDGMASEIAHAVATISSVDALLIPVQPTAADFWGLSDLVESIQQRRELANGGPLAGLVISRAIARTTLDREAVGALETFGLDLLDSRIHQRVVYPMAMARGSTVLDAEPDGPAAQEILGIWAEVKRSWL